MTQTTEGSSKVNTAAARVLGVGLAFNPALAHFVQTHRDSLDYLEISPERFWHDKGPNWGQSPERYTEIPKAVTQLDAVRGELPLLAHGVGLSIATAAPLDIGHVQQISRWNQRYGFTWFSEHLAYFRLGPKAGWRGMGIMLPPVYDADILVDLTIKLQEVREILGIEVLLENTVNYTPVMNAEFSEADFLNTLASKAQTRLLLDLHNLYTDAVNHGKNAFTMIDALDLMLVRELHIAGGEPLAGQWTDAHSGPCEPQVWELMDYVLSQPNGICAVTFEVDESYATRMDDATVLDELTRARLIWDRSLKKAHPLTHHVKP